MSMRVGQLGSLKIRLADWEPPADRYQRRYIPVDPESEVVSGDVTGLSGDRKFRHFVVRSFKGGEGEDIWKREGSTYRQSKGLVPLDIGDGLRLANLTEKSQITGGGGDLTGQLTFGVAKGLLWVAKDTTARSWDPVNEVWSSTVSIGGTNNVVSIADGQDTWVYSGHTNTTIRRWKSGSNELHFNVGFGWAPILRSFDARLFALDGDDLYEIDKTAADTRTAVADPIGESSYWLARGPTSQRMTTTDVGLVWLQRLDNGETFIWEYNVATETQSRIGRLPVNWVWPYSIHFAFGFVFVAFRVAAGHDEDGDAYVYWQRGAQRGVIGPIRPEIPPTAGYPVVLAGTLGRKLVIVYGDVWVYDTDSGGIVWFADGQNGQANLEAQATVFGRDIFHIGQLSGTDYVFRTRADKYIHTTNAPFTTSGTLDLGRHDWDYPGMEKILVETAVVTDPLPANTAVQVFVRRDGESSAQAVGIHDTTGATRSVFPWPADVVGTVRGHVFELQVYADSDDDDVTPVIREVSARATGASHVLEMVLLIDAGDFREQSSATLIAGLNALAAAKDIVTFTDPFQLVEKGTPDTFDVTVEEVFTPEVGDDHVAGPVSATVRLRVVGAV